MAEARERDERKTEMETTFSGLNRETGIIRIDVNGESAIITKEDGQTASGEYNVQLATVTVQESATSRVMIDAEDARIVGRVRWNAKRNCWAM